MMFRSLSIALAVASTAALAAGARPRVELQCESFGDGPQLDCTVRLRAADGAPLKDAKVTLGASMPSMPMAHSVRPVAAAATAKPGEYRGVLELQMTGVWAVQIDIAGAARERVVLRLRIDECPDDKRCPAPPARQ
ncbi:MAG: FixH family protein [Pseudomonadota bacterium]|jgi:hypothetical protein